MTFKNNVQFNQYKQSHNLKIRKAIILKYKINIQSKNI